MAVVTSNESNIKLAADLIRKGELVAFPTETVYGLGANAYEADAVRKIFALKGRPVNNPLIVHVASYEHIATVSNLNVQLENQLTKLRHLWPGPLTLVLPRATAIAAEVNILNNTIAVRIPAHEIAIKLLQKAAVPIAAPSANRSERVSPTHASHVVDEFGAELFVLDEGPSLVGIESTVLSLIHSKPTILRLGAIGVEELSQALSTFVDCEVTSANTLSPGALPLHYAPQTRLVVRINSEPPLMQPAALIAFRTPSQADQKHFKKICVLSESEDYALIARKLYSTLRELDQLGFALIVVDSCSASEQTLAAAIMDRLKRAVH